MACTVNRRFLVGSNATRANLSRVAFTLICAVWIGAACESFAQNAHADPVGMRVEFNHLGKSVAGEIVSVNRSGWPTIRFWDGQRVREQSMPKSRVTRVLGPDPRNQTRRWQDASGSHTVMAALANATDTHVQLRKKDGSKVALPIRRLSKRDQEYLAEAKLLLWQDGFPGQHESNALASNANASASNASRSNSRSRRIDNSAELTAEELLSDTPRLTEDLGRSFVPDPMPSVGDGSHALVSQQYKFDKKTNEVFAVTDSTRQFVLVDGPNTSSQTRDFRISDLKASGHTTRVRLEKSKDDPVGLSAHATHLFVRGRDPDSRRKVYKKISLSWDDDEVTDPESTTLFPMPDLVNRDAVLPGNRLLVSSMSQAGNSVWDIETGKPIVRFAGSSVLAISGGGRYAALIPIRQKRLIVVDLSESKIVREFPIAPKSVYNLGFDPSGQFLAAEGRNMIHVFDLVQNTRRYDHRLDGDSNTRGRLAWIGDRYLITPAHGVVDLVTGQPSWILPRGRHPLVQLDDRTIGEFANSGSLITLKCVRFDLDRMSESQTSVGDRAFKIPNDSVATIEVKNLGSLTEPVRKKLENSVVDLGYSLGPGGILTIEIDAKVRPKVTATIGKFRGDKNPVTVTYTPMTIRKLVTLGDSKLTMKTDTYDLVVVNKTIDLLPDETPQEGIDRMTKPTVGSVTLLKKIPLVGVIYDPDKSSLLGEGDLPSFANATAGQVLLATGTSRQRSRQAPPKATRTTPNKNRTGKTEPTPNPGQNRPLRGQANPNHRDFPGGSVRPEEIIRRFLENNGGASKTVRIQIRDGHDLAPRDLIRKLNRQMGPGRFVATRPGEIVFLARSYAGPLQKVVDLLDWANVDKIDQDNRIIHVRPKQ